MRTARFEGDTSAFHVLAKPLLSPAYPRKYEAQLVGLARPTQALVETIEAARNVYEFDDTVVAPQHGFTSADDYYRRSSALPFLDSINVPSLIIHAANDPWIPVAPYLAYPWEGNKYLTPLITNTGGHCGFHGQGSKVAWSDRRAIDFLESARLA